MAVIPLSEPRVRRGAEAGPALLSAGFRPFFLLAGAWAALAMPAWLAAYFHGYAPSASLPALHWHAHEMVAGYGLAAVAGFLLTAIPNWTGRLPVRGLPLAALVFAWVAGRIGLLFAGSLGAGAAMLLDLAFPVALAGVVGRELVAGRNWRNLPMLAAISLLGLSSLLVHLEALGLSDTAALGHRLGVGTLLATIALVGGRIIPSFTRNWLARQPKDKDGRGAPLPAQQGRADLAALLVTVAGLLAWIAVPGTPAASVLLLAAGLAAAFRLSRWRGLAAAREPLLLVLHAGYAWLALGLLAMGASGFVAVLPPTVALHALTAGAVGTMTLAVMTRASLGHSGQALVATPATVTAYMLVTIAALLRVAAPFLPSYGIVLSLAGLAWSAAFATFVVAYTPLLLRSRTL